MLDVFDWLLTLLCAMVNIALLCIRSRRVWHDEAECHRRRHAAFWMSCSVLGAWVAALIVVRGIVAPFCWLPALPPIDVLILCVIVCCAVSLASGRRGWCLLRPQKLFSMR